MSIVISIKNISSLLLLFCVTCFSKSVVAQYCAAQNTDCGFEFINNVTFDHIQRSSPCDGYGDYTGDTAHIIPGNQHTFTISKSGTLQNYVAIAYIDFNNDQVFDEVNERFIGALSNGLSVYTVVVDVPAGLSGPTRMRVRIAQNAAPGACGDIGRGDTEDYTINFTDNPPPIPDPPAGGGNYCIPSGGDCDPHITNVTFTGLLSNATACSNNGFGDFTQTHIVNMAPGTQNPFSATGSGGFIDIVMQGWIDFNKNGAFDDDEALFPAGVDYQAEFNGVIDIPADATIGDTLRLRLMLLGATGLPGSPCSPGNGETEDYSIHITDEPQIGGPYCNAQGDCSTGTGDYITRVRMDNGLDNSTAANGCTNYEDFTLRAAPAFVALGGTSTITLDFASSPVDRIGSVWIDWNQNRIFDNEELIGAIPGGATEFSLPVNVPGDARTGGTRMRILLGGAALGGEAPCDNTNKEVEDYTVIVGNVPDCVEQISPKFLTKTNGYKCFEDSLLVWRRTNEEGVSYQIHISTDQESRFIAENGIDDTTFVIPTNLLPDTTYYWQIIPVNDEGKAFGCTIDSFKVPANPDPTVDIIPDGNPLALCPFIPTQLDGQPMNGTSPFVHRWTGDTMPLNDTTIFDPIFEAENAGDYQLYYTLTDSNGCTATDSLLVTVFEADDVQIEERPLICFHEDTTQLNATPAGGIWSGNGIIDTVQGLFFAPEADTGLHEIIYKAGNINCTLFDTIYIRVSRPDTAIIDDIDTFCASDPNVFFTSNPSEGIWSGTGIVDENTGEFSPSTAQPGMHEIIFTVTDDLGCEAYDTATARVTGEDPRITPVDPVCDSDEPFQLTAASPGGLWTGKCITSARGGIFDPQICGPGTFKVVYTTTDDVFCDSKDSIEVVIIDGPTVSAGIDYSICDTGTVQIGGNPTAMDGKAPFTFLWEPRVGLSDDRHPNPFASPSETTTFTVFVTDSAGCIGKDSATVVINPQSFFVLPGDNRAICNGESTILGQSPPVEGAIQPISYTWAPSASLNNDTVPNPAASPTMETQYTLTVTDGTNCTYSDSVVVSVNENPIADAGEDQSICERDSVILGSNPSASKGTKPYEYLWQPTSQNLDGPNPTASPVNDIVYTLTVTDSNGCSDNDAVAIFVSKGLIADAGEDEFVCIGTNVQIGGSPSARSGNRPYTYTWVSDSSVSDFKLSNPIAIIDTIQTYTLVVEDAAGCRDIDTVMYSVYAQPIADAGEDRIVCAGGSAVLGGQPTASNGEGSYQVVWRPTPGSNNANLPNPTTAPATSTTFTVEVTDANKCVAEDEVIVTLVERPEIVFEGLNSVYCAESKPTLLFGSPAAGTFSGNGIIPGTTIKESLDPDANKTILDNATTTFSFNTSSALDTKLLGSTVQLSDVTVRLAHEQVSQLEIALINPAGNRIRLVSRAGIPNSTAGCANSNISATVVPGVFAPSLMENTCSEADTAIFGTFRAQDDLDLLNDGTQASGQWKLEIIDFVAGKEGKLIEWSMRFGTPSQFDPSQAITGEQTISYTYEHHNGCISTTTQEVSISDVPLLNAGLDKGLCNGDSATLGGTPTIQGGTGPYKYNWAPSTGLSHTNTANPNAAPTEPTTYTLTATDANGCIAQTFEKSALDMARITGIANDPLAAFDFVVDGNTVEFYNNSSADAVFWFWEFDNGEVSATKNPTMEYDKTSEFDVCLTVTNINQCSDRICRAVKVEFTGLEEVNQSANDFNFYPNPVTETLNITHTFNEESEITITNIAGKIWYRTTATPKAFTQIDVANLPAGTYIILLKTSTEMQRSSFIKVD